MNSLHHFSALELWSMIRRNELRVTELTAHYLERIERLDPKLGAFTAVTSRDALSRAEELDAQSSRSGTIWGLPFADKDLVQRAGVPTRFGSAVFEDFVPSETDQLASQLDAEGGISLGKTATPEFGMTSYTESSSLGVTRNAWNVDYGAGGSSGGAAAAVAAGLIPFAPGSDGGGSIRIPASANGLVGLKSSRGLIPSADGHGSLGGLPVAGTLTRTVADAALLLDAMVPDSARRGHHFTALHSANFGPFLPAAVRGEGRYQVGLSWDSPWKDSFEITLDPEVKAAVLDVANVLDQLGHGVEELDPVAEPNYASTFTTLWKAGASTLPVPADQVDRLESITRWLMLEGQALSAKTLAEALHEAAQFEQRSIRRFSSCDVVLMPTVALLPRPLGWYSDTDPVHNFAQQVQYSPYTSFVNVAGLPAISLPVARSTGGLPIGVQLIGRPGQESTLLSVSAQLERRYRWNERHAPGWE